MHGLMRKVVDDYCYRKASCPVNGATRVLKLECGHEIARKASQPVPKRAHCPDCENLELSK